jgi:hypothetical protein
MARGAKRAMKNRAKQAANAQYAAALIDDQHKRGGRVTFAHPWGIEFLREQVMQDVLRRWNLRVARLDQCAVALRDRSSGLRHLKPTVIVTNDRTLAERIAKWCNRSHETLANRRQLCIRKQATTRRDLSGGDGQHECGDRDEASRPRGIRDS